MADRGPADTGTEGTGTGPPAAATTPPAAGAAATADGERDMRPSRTYINVNRLRRGEIGGDAAADDRTRRAAAVVAFTDALSLVDTTTTYEEIVDAVNALCQQLEDAASEYREAMVDTEETEEEDVGGSPLGWLLAVLRERQPFAQALHALQSLAQPGDAVPHQPGDTDDADVAMGEANADAGGTRTGAGAGAGAGAADTPNIAVVTALVRFLLASVWLGRQRVPLSDLALPYEPYARILRRWATAAAWSPLRTYSTALLARVLQHADRPVIDEFALAASCSAALYARAERLIRCHCKGGVECDDAVDGDADARHQDLTATLTLLSRGVDYDAHLPLVLAHKMPALCIKLVATVVRERGDQRDIVVQAALQFLALAMTHQRVASLAVDHGVLSLFITLRAGPFARFLTPEIGHCLARVAGVLWSRRRRRRGYPRWPALDGTPRGVTPGEVADLVLGLLAVPRAAPRRAACMMIAYACPRDELMLAAFEERGCTSALLTHIRNAMSGVEIQTKRVRGTARAMTEALLVLVRVHVVASAATLVGRAASHSRRRGAAAQSSGTSSPRKADGMRTRLLTAASHALRPAANSHSRESRPYVFSSTERVHAAEVVLFLCTRAVATLPNWTFGERFARAGGIEMCLELVHRSDDANTVATAMDCLRMLSYFPVYARAVLRGTTPDGGGENGANIILATLRRRTIPIETKVIALSLIAVATAAATPSPREGVGAVHHVPAGWDAIGAGRLGLRAGVHCAADGGEGMRAVAAAVAATVHPSAEDADAHTRLVVDARTCLRNVGGIRELMDFLQSDEEVEPHRMDEVKHATLSALVGLARDPTIAMMLGQVGATMIATVEVAVQPAVSDGMRRSIRERVRATSTELLRLVSNAARTTRPLAAAAAAMMGEDAGAGGELDVDRENVVARTHVSYSQTQLLGLIHRHLIASGLGTAADALATAVAGKRSPAWVPWPGQAPPAGAPTLDSIITSHLRDQHRRCAKPLGAPPPFDLLRPHACPLPRARLQSAARGGGRDVTTRCLAREARVPMRTFRALDDDVSCAEFLGPGGDRLIVGTWTGSVQVFEVPPPSLPARMAADLCENPRVTWLPFDGIPVSKVSPSADGCLVAASSHSHDDRDSQVVLWRLTARSGGELLNPDAHDVLHTWPEHSSAVFGRPGGEVVLATRGRAASLFDTVTGHTIATFDDRPQAPAGPANSRDPPPRFGPRWVYRRNAASFSPDGALVLSNGCLWDPRDGGTRPIHQFDMLDPQAFQCFNPNGLEVIIGSAVWDARLPRLRTMCPALDGCLCVPASAAAGVLFALPVPHDQETPFSPTYDVLDANDYTHIGRARSLHGPLSGLAIDPMDGHVVLTEKATGHGSVARMYAVGRRSGQTHPDDHGGAGVGVGAGHDADTRDGDDVSLDGSQSDGEGDVASFVSSESSSSSAPSARSASGSPSGSDDESDHVIWSSSGSDRWVLTGSSGEDWMEEEEEENEEEVEGREVSDVMEYLAAAAYLIDGEEGDDDDDISILFGSDAEQD